MNKDIILLRTVEVAAIASYKYIGKKNKNILDGAAVEAMEKVLNSAEGFSIKVVNGEGELDNAPMLYSGQILGDKSTKVPMFDVCVDPVEGTNPAASNFAGSIATIAISRLNTMLKLPEMYMEKLFVSNQLKDCADLQQGIIACVQKMQKKAKKKDIKAIILDKPRHNEIIKKLDKMGVIVRLIKDGDVLAAIDVVNGEADFVYGIGGAPEGGLMASLAISSGCKMMAKLVGYDQVWPHEKETKQRVEYENKELQKINLSFEKYLDDNDLIKDPRTRFFAAGITAGGTLKAIDYLNGKYYVSAFMSSHGVIRNIKSVYDIDQINALKPEIKYLFDKYKRK
ncbi:fructose-bisphosphatase class II [Williamsoniiplasma luminosum]|uniref:fructose-bisphosphatase n=1 Tax=Williamsoniiplasma luminosum TaxID=214888 RepID=A0A2S0NKA3_9MOLU|nr:fructose-bisphosphatase class II [Williamsoniiplasma luminosum]AVP49435.1 MAG: fructose-bisphosphatase class II [Williamsoniiplasma luminosum]